MPILTDLGKEKDVKKSKEEIKESVQKSSHKSLDFNKLDESSEKDEVSTDPRIDSEIEKPIKEDLE